MKISKFNHFIIEGVDRLGKDTLINGLCQSLGYHQVIHFQRPKQLACYVEGEDDPVATFRYQQASFKNMFSILASDAKTIMNRAHLGEYVYSPLYRGYRGDYVFELEHEALTRYSQLGERTLLIYLYTSTFSFIKDDGQSFDFAKKEDEQIKFGEAVNRSLLPHKLAIDVHNGWSAFEQPDRILQRVLNRILQV